MNAQTLTWIRSTTFAVAGLICATFALGALFGVQALPNWLPIAGGVMAALIVFVCAAIAGPRNMAASLDESYHTDKRTAATFGFWGALATGTGLWLLNIGGDMQLAITMNVAAALYLLSQVVMDLRGYR